MLTGKLKRYQDIIAFEELQPDSQPKYIAFHANNLEIAEISSEAFNEMIEVDVRTGDIPKLKPTTDFDAFEELESWNNDINSDARPGQIDFGIRSLTINVTQVCNLKCTYCAAGGDGTYGDPVTRISVEKTLPQLKYFIDALPSGRKFTISFVGGEPLLYPGGIKAIYDYVTQIAAEKNIFPVFSVTTNATVITDKVLEIFKQIKIHVTVSLDGDKNVNDVLRPTRSGAGSTQMTLDGLQKLHSIKSYLPSLGISGVFNEAHQNIVESYRFFLTLNPDWIEFNFAYSQNSSELQKKYLEQMNQIAEIAWQHGKETSLRKVRTFEHYFGLLDNQQKVENHCGAGKSFLMMDAKNQLYTCPWVVGDPDEVVGQGVNLNMEKLSKFQKPLIKLNNCQTCWARYLCGGGCMYIHKAHTGSKHTKDNLFCERTRSLILTALLYYKKARSAETTSVSTISKPS